MSNAKQGECCRDEARQCRREGGKPHLIALLAREVGDLGVGELQTPCDLIGVFEQDRAGVGEAQSAGAPVE